MKVREMIAPDPETDKLFSKCPTVEVGLEIILMTQHLLNPANLMQLSVGNLLQVQAEINEIIAQARAVPDSN